MKLDKYEYKILDLCENLHMSATGAGDIIYGEEQGEMMAALTKRVCEWTPSPHTDEYDTAVKILILVTLNEQMVRMLERDVQGNKSLT